MAAAAAPGLSLPVVAVVLALLAGAIAAADPAAMTGSCDPRQDSKLTELASCVQELLAGMPSGDELLRGMFREHCCGIVRRSVDAGERCVCVFAENERTNVAFFSQDAFELVCGDIRLQQHCKDHRRPSVSGGNF